MMDAYLFVCATSVHQFGKQFSIDHCSTGFQGIALEEVCVQKFKGTIEITHLDSECQANDHFPAPGVEFAHPGILAIQTIANNRIILINGTKQKRQITNIELPVRIHKEG